MGNKNIATTHLSNGSYRLHPVEWNIGAVAGELCDEALLQQCEIVEIWHQKAKLHAFQKRLVGHQHPIAWSVDVPFGHECFAVTQYLIVRGILQTNSWRANQLEIACNQPLTDAEWHALTQILSAEGLSIAESYRNASWHDVCMFVHHLLFNDIR
jgi:hypothetical protein